MKAGLRSVSIAALALIFSGLQAQAQDSQERPSIQIAPPEALSQDRPQTEEDPAASGQDELGPQGKLDSVLSTIPEKPDYSKLTPKAEREARLDALFERLQTQTNAEDADLVVEEIWAIWLDSGSATVNFVMERGTNAQKSGDTKLARRMFDHVTSLKPEYAEGWARSSRLAYEEEDFSRAVSEALQALVYEPRHFYAMWTLGNIFEKLGDQEKALEAYSEANKLYPEMESLKNRVEFLQNQLDGDVL